MKGVSIAMDKKESTNKLIMHLNSIINHEVEKPYTEMDADLVEACVELSLELQGKNYTLSNEELEEKVRKIPFVDTKEFLNAAQKKRKKINKRKILLIAAIIAILCTLLTIISSGYNFDDIHRIMREKFGSVFNVPIGESQISGDIEYGNLGGYNTYTSVQDFFRNESYDVLMPGKLTNGVEVTDIFVVQQQKELIVSFDTCITEFIITLHSTLNPIAKESADDIIDIEGLCCYIKRIDDVGNIQIDFEHNGNCYSISGTDEQILLGVIENLEEYK